MKKHLFILILVFAWLLQFGQVNAQSFSVNANLIVTPESPKANDSILLTYAYTSSDGCPDYYLAIDSVSKNKIFVVRKPILTKPACTAMVTQFKTTVNLGVLEQNTEIYFEYRLFKTIVYQCVADKTGLVVWGQEECANRLFIEDTSSPKMSPLRQLYEIGRNSLNNAANSTKLKAGDQVKFGSVLTNRYTVFNNPCNVIGVATCFEVADATPCIMDKKGEVIDIIDRASIVKSGEYIYSISNVELKIGTIITFKGTLIQCVKAPCYNIIECYKIIETPPTPCVMDKKGVVIGGIQGHGNTLFVAEYSPISSYRALYRIENSLHIKLNVGDEVKFGAKMIANDSVLISVNRIVGVVTCFEIVSSTPNPPCIMNRKGKVVVGQYSCANELFIQDISLINSRLMLYRIAPKVYLANAIVPTLKVGDEVIFGGETFRHDSLSTDSCTVAGIAYCYELIQKPVGSFTLKGKAMVGKDLMKSGMAYLFRKGNPKPQTVSSIIDSIYQFSNVLAGLYTVYVIPNIMEYPNCLPTFYINKFRYSQANYINLNEDKSDVVVMLNSYNLPKGNGIVRGNIFFESLNLKDSVMNALVKYRGATYNNDRSAASIPVTIYNNIGDAVAWSVSDELGNYAIENLSSGSYLIVAENGSAKAESTINLTDDDSIINADLILKVGEDVTAYNQTHLVSEFYPNPVRTIFNLKVIEPMEAYLYNAMGQVVLSKKLNQGMNTIDFSNIKSGIYLLKTYNNTLKIRKY